MWMILATGSPAGKMPSRPEVTSRVAVLYVGVGRHEAQLELPVAEAEND